MFPMTSTRQNLTVDSVLSEFGLQQYVSEPTHIKGHILDILITSTQNSLITSHSIIDLGFINDKGMLVKDHFAISWKLKAERKEFQSVTRKVRRWKNLDMNAFKEDLQSSINDRGADQPDSISLVDWFMDTLSNLVEKHAPEQVIVISRKPNPWYSEEIRMQKRERRRLERKWMKSKLNIDHEIYRRQCALTFNKIRLARMNFNKDLLSDCGHDQKKVYSVANRLLGRKKVSSFPKANTDEQCANEFIQFFNDKVNRIHTELTCQRDELLLEHPGILESMATRPTPHLLHTLQPSTVDEVTTILRKMPNKQCELDPCPMWLLKSLEAIVIPVITDIVNTSLSSATLPNSLKTAIVRPSLKEPALDSNEHNSFRPVSNLSILSKLIENVVYNRLTKHINENNLFGKNQSAYRKYHSTETALLKVQNDILLSLDQGKFVALVMVDVSAAFDTVEHHSLLARFRHDFGLRGKALQWMQSYISDRKQKVAINSAYSRVINIDYGFAQGATLAGLCFNCYSKPLNDIADNFKSVNQHSYADDSQTYTAFTCKNKEDAMGTLQKCLNETRKWMIINHLKVNDGKTKVIIFSPNKHISTDLAINIKFGSSKIKPSSQVKNLGVIMDNLLNMEKQINKCTSSAYFHIRNISKVRKYLDTKTTKTLVHTLVISRIDYCNSLFVNLPKQLLKKIQRAQNTAARLIAKTPKRAHITPVLKDLHWLPVTARVKFKVLLLTYKCIIGQAPIYLTELLGMSRTLRSNTGANGTLQERRFQKKKHGSRAFKIAAPTLWNSIPTNIRDSTSVTQFKSLLKTFLFMQYYSDF